MAIRQTNNSILIFIAPFSYINAGLAPHPYLKDAEPIMLSLLRWRLLCQNDHVVFASNLVFEMVHRAVYVFL